MLGWLLSGRTRVSAFTVHEPPHVPPASGGTRLGRAESLVFVGDGFSWRAALFSPVYLIVCGEWLALAVYAAAAVALSAFLALIGAEPDWAVWMFVLLNVVIGFEMSGLKRWSLARAGWREIAAVSGRGQDDAERRFFEAWLPTVPADGSDAGDGAHNAAAGFETRLEASVRRLARRLRTPFAPGT
jgi:hypothetical protein